MLKLNCLLPKLNLPADYKTNLRLSKNVISTGFIFYVLTSVPEYLILFSELKIKEHQSFIRMGQDLLTFISPMGIFI